MFVFSNSDLNIEQISAVLEKKSVLLMSCPGSGKTRTLTYKIAYELSTLGNKKKFIIAITYTNRAADEVKERIELLGVNTKQLWIGTIHAFCLEWILHPYSQYSNRLKYGFRVINSYDTEKIISNLCEKFNTEKMLYGSEKVKYWDCQYFFNSTEGIVIQSPSSNKKNKAKEIIKRYLKLILDNNQIDFELILFYSNKLLEDKPNIAKVLSNLFQYILIDEYQDTKEIQYQIICKILKKSENSPKLFMVGDPNQAIYQSMGGFPIRINELKQQSGLDIKQMMLKNNYRSSTRIVEYFNYFNTIPNEIIPMSKDKDYEGKIVLNTEINKDNLLEKISKIIITNIEEYNILQNEICILAPQWVHLASITRRLMAKLPDYSFDGPHMAPIYRDVDNFWYKISRIALTASSPDLYVRRLRWSEEILAQLSEIHSISRNIDNIDFLKICNSINPTETDGLKYLEKYFYILLDRLNIDINSSPMLLEHLNAYFSSALQRIQRLEKDGIEGVTSIDAFRKIFKQRNGITVSTYHGIKGAEFDTVIAFALLKDYIPHFSDQNGVENSKKLLYVITSRARKNIYLFGEKGHYYHFGSPPREHTLTQHLIDYKYKYDEEI